MTGFFYGQPPTREEVLEEIGRELVARHIRLRGVTMSVNNEHAAYCGVDRLQAAYDWIQAHWPAWQPALFADK